jgi:hypothetical protein
LNPNVIGTIDKASKEVIEKERRAEREELEAKKLKNKKKKNKQRGRDGPDGAVLGKANKREIAQRERARYFFGSHKK